MKELVIGHVYTATHKLVPVASADTSTTGFTCGSCKSPVSWRTEHYRDNGNTFVRGHYFHVVGHGSPRPCYYLGETGESSLHHQVKMEIASLQNLTVKTTCLLCDRVDKVVAWDTWCPDAVWEVEGEVTYAGKSYRADILVRGDAGTIAIEVVWGHDCPEEKLKAYRMLDIHRVQVDASYRNGRVHYESPVFVQDPKLCMECREMQDYIHKQEHTGVCYKQGCMIHPRS